MIGAPAQEGPVRLAKGRTLHLPGIYVYWRTLRKAAVRYYRAFMQSPDTRRVMAFFLAFWLALPGSAALAQARFSEVEVKAAFLYNFSGFVTFPPEARVDEGIVIGVMGADDVELELRRTAAARPGRPVTVKRVATVDDAAAVHILFVGWRENASLGKILQAVRLAPVLTVTEAPDGIDRGSIINFVTAERVQFEVSLEAAARARLHLNARLLSVAMRVRKGAFPGKVSVAAAYFLPHSSTSTFTRVFPFLRNSSRLATASDTSMITPWC
jgi:hypothetical protein